MQVKRYLAATMRHGLKQVREELGPEAVILSSKRVADGVEILVALEQGESPVKKTEAPSLADNPFRVDEGAATAERKKASRLEAELDEWHRANQQRARVLADAIAKQHAQPAPVQPTPTPGSALQSETAEPDPDVVTLRSVASTQADTTTPQPAMPDSQPGPAVAQAFAETMAATQLQAANTTASPEPASNHSVQDDVSDLRKEIQSMRDMLEQQLSSAAWGSYRQQQPQQAGLWRRMKRMGLSAPLAQALLDSLPKKTGVADKDLWQMLMGRLAQALPVGEEDMIVKGGVFALVGATGAGKTTTIGKLATRYVLEHGPDQVALVTTDTARIAAFEQLRTFGRILNVPVKVVDRNTSLEQVLHSLRHKSLVLVDTAGLNQQDDRLQQQLNSLNELSGRVKTLLALPATSQAAVIKAVYHAYKGVDLAGCILTKLDEAASIGEVLSLTTDKKLPIIYTTNGQAIPNDLQVAESYALIRTAIELAKPVTVNDDAMADEVSTLGGS